MKRIFIDIDGMKCGMCEVHINDIIRTTCKVKKVTSSHRKGQSIILCEDMIDLNQIIDAIEQDGYKVLSIQEEIYVKKILFH